MEDRSLQHKAGRVPTRFTAVFSPPRTAAYSTEVLSKHLWTKQQRQHTDLGGGGRYSFLERMAPDTPGRVKMTLSSQSIWAGAGQRERAGATQGGPLTGGCGTGWWSEEGSGLGIHLGAQLADAGD